MNIDTVYCSMMKTAGIGRTIRDGVNKLKTKGVKALGGVTRSEVDAIKRNADGVINTTNQNAAKAVNEAKAQLSNAQQELANVKRNAASQTAAAAEKAGKAASKAAGKKAGKVIGKKDQQLKETRDMMYEQARLADKYKRQRNTAAAAAGGSLIGAAGAGAYSNWKKRKDKKAE